MYYVENITLTCCSCGFVYLTIRQIPDKTCKQWRDMDDYADTWLIFCVYFINNTIRFPMKASMNKKYFINWF